MAESTVGRLLCLPPAGAGASFFGAWPRTVAGLTVEPLDLPGRGAKAGVSPTTSVVALARSLAAEVGHPGSRWSVFGHSLGSVVGFELVRELRRRHGVEPEALVVSGRSAPHERLQGPLVHDLPVDQFVAAIVSYGGTPPQLAAHPEFAEAFVPVLRADFTAGETYQWAGDEPLSCPVVAVVATDDHTCGPADLRRWRRTTVGTFRLVYVPGDHFYARLLPEGLGRVLGEAGQ